MRGTLGELEGSTTVNAAVAASMFDFAARTGSEECVAERIEPAPHTPFVLLPPDNIVVALPHMPTTR